MKAHGGTYAVCASRLASSLGKANGQGRHEDAGDRELHVCEGVYAVVLYWVDGVGDAEHNKVPGMLQSAIIIV